MGIGYVSGDTHPAEPRQPPNSAKRQANVARPKQKMMSENSKDDIASGKGDFFPAQSRKWNRSEFRLLNFIHFIHFVNVTFPPPSLDPIGLRKLHFLLY